jgi:hypothetical protein
VLLAVACLAPAGAVEARPSAAIVLDGTVTLEPFDVTKKCRFGGTTAAARMSCTVYGAYAGRPRAAGAGYGWVWNIPRNAMGVTELYGSERGTLLLVFDQLGTLTLTLTGRQHPVGKQTTAHAKVTTTGTWTMTAGTGRLVGAHGRGTYAYTIVRNDSPTVFSRATVVLAGRIAGGPLVA